MSALTNLGAWQTRAACRGPHAAVFFPPTSFERKNDKINRERRAKAICKQCSVMTECREYALEIRERHGIWGGLNELERQDILGEQFF
ncbi:MAG: WhiB family transcriptional regulator [bacterium]|nr:WhiB family transcriptional regulator [bacterium]MCY4163116.1 WhiB family transcriptional regulator [bacterium]MCY4258457.1 WhiB family transcriptional regulator [bacterium]